MHYYSNIGDRLPVLGDEERETRQTFQELVQLGHTCVVMLRRAIWSVDPTVFNPQYNLQVRLDSIHTALSQLAAQTGVYLTNPPVVQVDESVFDEVHATHTSISSTRRTAHAHKNTHIAILISHTSQVVVQQGRIVSRGPLRPDIPSCTTA